MTGRTGAGRVAEGLRLVALGVRVLVHVTLGGAALLAAATVASVLAGRSVREALNPLPERPPSSWGTATAPVGTRAVAGSSRRSPARPGRREAPRSA
ncbi:hypothetical protein [Streptomyces sp. NPDC093990]|uniref:hypothetical protein n=1 Tax=Streptomyces sp. NPDC093990 TaxID=3155306 RepID=UPI003426D5D9